MPPTWGCKKLIEKEKTVNNLPQKKLIFIIYQFQSFNVSPKNKTSDLTVLIYYNIPSFSE